LSREIDQARAVRLRLKKFMARVAPVAAALSAALLLWHAASDRPPLGVGEPAPLIYAASDRADASAGGAATPVGNSAQGGAAASGGPATAGGAIATQQAGVVSTVVVGRNDTLDAIFGRMALDKADLAAIRNLPGIRQSIDFLKPGDAIKLTHAAGEVRELTRKVSETQTLKVVRQDDGFAAQIIENPVETRIRSAAAVIDSSVFQGAEAAGISDIVALKLANIFAWDIDFVLDIRSGDRFTAVYEQIYQNGRYLRDGEILAAEFVNGGKVYRAVGFKGDSGVQSYYTPAGQPMRKAFLRAPVDFTRVSSVFDPRRFHPILQTIRGHMGTDYAAPVGTPVHASGDGRVSFVGRRGGYGNAIVLAHSNGVSTLYGHLSRFASRIRVGTPVQQGEVIGFVGMTGLATGPHLHYEYLVGGVHKNPQTVQLPGAEPLRAEALQRFLAAAAPLMARLEPPPGPTAASNLTDQPGGPSMPALPAASSPGGRAPIAAN
jgi:murein DD-endopeptidase MepM/ murein hydrolase activator NlpD